MSIIDNPYWDLVRDAVKPHLAWGTAVVDWYSDAEALKRAYANGTDRRSLVRRFSWTIPDPETLAFVVEHSDGRVVDPMAGTGYWGWLLAQHGVDVVSYDLMPAANSYHEGQPLYSHVEAMDGADAARLHSDRTLLLSWPPMDDAGTRVLRAYAGSRVIYIGEGEGGCTGDDDLHALLAKDWTSIAERVPVQWDGLHDVVTVYERVTHG